MFGMGWFEIVMILMLALVVLGPEKLPKLAKTAGKAMRQLRRATADLRQAIDIEGMREDMRAPLSQAKRAFSDPYAGVAEEESRWAAGEDEIEEADDFIIEDADPLTIHRHHGDLYSETMGKAASSGAQSGGARRVNQEVTAEAIKPLELDPHTVHLSPIARQEEPPSDLVSVAVTGGIAEDLARLQEETAALQEAAAALPEADAMTRVALPPSTLAVQAGVTIERQELPAPPLELLGGITAVNLKREPS